MIWSSDNREERWASPAASTNGSLVRKRRKRSEAHRIADSESSELCHPGGLKLCIVKNTYMYTSLAKIRDHLLDTVNVYAVSSQSSVYVLYCSYSLMLINPIILTLYPLSRFMTDCCQLLAGIEACHAKWKEQTLLHLHTSRYIP